jgi:hypothetical protein
MKKRKLALLALCAALACVVATLMLHPVKHEDESGMVVLLHEAEWVKHWRPEPTWWEATQNVYRRAMGLPMLRSRT